MNRRELIQNISLLLGGTIVGGSIFMQQGCKPATPQVADLLSESKQAWLGELVETILPATKTPGAKEAGVAAFIPVMVKDCYTPENQKIFLEGISTIDKLSNEKYKNDFISITSEQRTELLTQLDKEQKEYQQNKKKEDPSHYFRMMKELTLLGFFTSETGATKAMRYIAIPGKYEACVPYVKGDKAWAS